MKLYLWLKIIHIISSAILFGTGIGTAFFMWYANLKKDIELIAKATQQVVFADWVFTGSSGIIQAVTGFAMMYLAGYSWLTPWLLGSILGYFIAGACWVPVVWLQIRLRDIAFQAHQAQQPLPPKYYQYYQIWWILGIPAFLALIVVFYLMTNKPQLFF